jgi:hypothetical protein
MPPCSSGPPLSRERLVCTRAAVLAQVAAPDLDPELNRLLLGIPAGDLGEENDRSLAIALGPGNATIPSRSSVQGAVLVLMRIHEGT